MVELVEGTLFEASRQDRHLEESWCLVSNGLKLESVERRHTSKAAWRSPGWLAPENAHPRLWL